MENIINYELETELAKLNNGKKTILVFGTGQVARDFFSKIINANEEYNIIFFNRNTEYNNDGVALLSNKIRAFLNDTLSSSFDDRFNIVVNGTFYSSAFNNNNVVIGVSDENLLIKAINYVDCIYYTIGKSEVENLRNNQPIDRIINSIENRGVAKNYFEKIKKTYDLSIPIIVASNLDNFVAETVQEIMPNSQVIAPGITSDNSRLKYILSSYRNQLPSNFNLALLGVHGNPVVATINHISVFDPFEKLNPTQQSILSQVLETTNLVGANYLIQTKSIPTASLTNAVLEILNRIFGKNKKGVISAIQNDIGVIGLPVIPQEGLLIPNPELSISDIIINNISEVYTRIKGDLNSR